jgi:hypothetical protein
MPIQTITTKGERHVIVKIRDRDRNRDLPDRHPTNSGERFRT